MNIPKETFKEFLRLDLINNDRVISFCLKQKTLEEAIKIAILSRDIDNKKHKHQYRIANIQLKVYYNKVSLIETKIKNVKSFEELLNLLIIEKTVGIGYLALYDIALRIGYYIKIKPDFIYLHAGAKTGAINFFGRKIKNKYLSKDEFVAKATDFKNFSCAEIEAFLCIHCNNKKNNKGC
jgi:hypothetical protein